jgi:hypothetical protein
MSSNNNHGFAIKDGIKLGGLNGVKGPGSKYYPFKSTPVGMAAIGMGASSSKSFKEPLKETHPQQPKQQQEIVVIPAPQTTETELKLVSHLRTSHDYQEVLSVENMDNNISYITPTRASTISISSITLVLFLLNTWAMDGASSNPTIHTWMGILNCLTIPMISMCIGYSMVHNPESPSWVSMCGCMALSMFSILFLTMGTFQMDDENHGPAYMAQQATQLFGCIFASIYCTWRLSLKFSTTSSKTIEKARREWAVIGCLFLLQCLFSLLAVFIQDPIIVLWVWAVVAWGCTLP